ncbi:hypothetical protein SAMN02745221_00365 [Thermosyntropha lipolytica DSM 11003]|uniref:AAA+ ATPase domain-containing protein n=1 Tax=Thermosyntropha lipolytica DSM 11003 TaxID=1123382 RepID=A0A1M5KFI6_9FIRM|nr:ATP-binding protein [Thermosyntropha lipolytica]SHG51694.1 hypothetical protein SAMN02745221_00365 [Thermosyntropha lipolytica DSM 11003]
MLKKLRLALASLTVYRNFLQEKPVIKLIRHLDDVWQYGQDSLQAVESYHDFIFTLYLTGLSLDMFLLDFILHDDNPFSREAEHKPLEEISEHMVKAAARDLAVLQELYNFPWREVYSSYPLPCFTHAEKEGAKNIFQGQNWPDALPSLAVYYAENSRGVVSRYRALRWEKGKGLVGVKNPEVCHLDDLLGLEEQIKKLCLNTECFLKGYPANNVLLYGPRGTGKSTMIKALLTRYKDTRLRLVEIRREEVKELNKLVERLKDYKLRFIIYIDDLSFEDYETGYKGLKAVLEGNIQEVSDNVLVYATSNRRHLVKEYFSDRLKADEEIHFFDSMEEKLSLSDRFGLVITVPAPDRTTYLAIVQKLALAKGIHMEKEELEKRALAWSRNGHGFSGRSARQFVYSLGEYCQA